MTRRIAVVLSFAAAICAVIQIGLGANLLILSLALLSIACGLYGFWLFGLQNLAGMMALFYVGGTVLLALYAKTAFLQPLQTNLYEPSQSFLVLFVCALLFLGAMICANWIDVGRPIQPIYDPGVLRFISTIAFIIGIAARFFHWYVDRGIQGPEYGGVAMFGSLTYLGIISRTAYVMLRSGMKRHLDGVLVAMLVIATLSGVMENGRGNTAMPCIIFFITIFFFRRSLPWRYTVAALCFAVLFAALVPLILVFRYAGFRKMTFTQEISAFENIIPLLLNSDEFSFETGKILSLKVDYCHYYGPGKGQIIGRFSSIQQIDPAVSATDAGNPMGSDIIVSALGSILPKAINPDKLQDTSSLVILSRQGWVRPEHGLYPTLPMAGELYSAFGMTGLIFTFPVFLLYLLAYKKIGWSLDCNIIGIFFLSFYVWHDYDANMEGLISGICRDIPVDIILILGLQRVYLFLTQQKRGVRGSVSEPAAQRLTAQ